jgi:hypothetical protein
MNMTNMINKKNFFISIIALCQVFNLAQAEVVGKSIATVNGDAIFLSEFQANWETLLDQQKQSGDKKEITNEWKKKSKKFLLDQMVEEKLLLQEAKKQKIVVPKRQLEEGVLQVKNRFKILPPETKPSKEDYERELTSKEKVEFDKELKTQNLTEKEFEARIEDQLRVLRLSEDQIRSQIPIPFKETKTKDPNQDRELTPEYEKQAKELFAEIEKKFNDKNFKPDPESNQTLRAKLIK